MYKVLLTTSGTGTRLGELTKNTNKALIEINGKPAIAYILDAYPSEVPIVVTIGYLAVSVKNFLLKNYPKRKFEFVMVNKYEGPGTSLGYSMLQAKANLQCPFIFHPCDTIPVWRIPPPSKNWIGGFLVDEKNSELPLKHYRTHNVQGNKIIELKDKGVPGFESIHIGLDGIKDYQDYWTTLEEIYNEDPNFKELCDVQVLDRMIKNGSDFTLIPFPVWLDIGNLTALKNTEEYLQKHSYAKK